jgi:uncharacterized protein
VNSYRDITALVTGASSGIGEALAYRLAERGADLVLTARSGDQLNALANTLRQNHGCQVDVFCQDLGQPKGAETLFEKTKAANIHIDLLVNNAGFGKWGEFLEFDMDCYNQMLTLNINALVTLTHCYLPAMLEKKSGGILNLASTASYLPTPYAAVYGASKAFVLQFSEALHGEYAHRGIHIMALSPGGTATQFAHVANPDVDRSSSTMATPESVATFGLDALLQGKCSAVPGGKNQLTAFLPRLLPRIRVINIAKKVWLGVIRGDEN